MTSLIDVIFLLLLFFMLSSTFDRHGEIELMASASFGSEPSEERALFMRLSDNGMTLNGVPVNRFDLPSALAKHGGDGRTQVLLALTGEVSSQQFVGTLAVLRSLPGLDVAVIE